jgi:hypothetical protein
VSPFTPAGFVMCCRLTVRVLLSPVIVLTTLDVLVVVFGIFEAITGVLLTATALNLLLITGRDTYTYRGIWDRGDRFKMAHFIGTKLFFMAPRVSIVELEAITAIKNILKLLYFIFILL